ncbi:MAG: hypothetical protein AB7F31_05790 [Parachlamydiales bacterium]
MTQPVHFTGSNAEENLQQLQQGARTCQPISVGQRILGSLAGGLIVGLIGGAIGTFGAYWYAIHIPGMTSQRFHDLLKEGFTCGALLGATAGGLAGFGGEQSERAIYEGIARHLEQKLVQNFDDFKPKTLNAALRPIWDTANLSTKIEGEISEEVKNTLNAAVSDADPLVAKGTPRFRDLNLDDLPDSSGAQHLKELQQFFKEGERGSIEGLFYLCQPAPAHQD